MTGLPVDEGIVNQTTSRMLGAFVAVACCLLALQGCADEVDSENDDGTFDFDEPSQWKQLDGPPGGYDTKIGTVGDRLYIALGSVRGSNPDPVAFYEAGEGWQREPALDDILSGEHWGTYFDSIVGLEGTYYTIGDDGNLHRTTDEGDSWEQGRAIPFDPRSWRTFGTDGRALFVLVSEDPDIEVWRKKPGGEWQTVRELSRDAEKPWLTTRMETSPDLIVLEGDGIEFSTDSGESWTEMGDECEGLTSSGPSVVYNGDALFQSGPDLLRVDGGSCEKIELGPLNAVGEEAMEDTEPDIVGDFEVIDGKLYGITETGFGRVQSDLSGWAEIRRLPVPVSVTVIDMALDIFDFGAEGIGVMLPGGLWLTDDGGQTWESAHHHSSNPDWVLDDDGKIVTSDRTRLVRGDKTGTSWEIERGWEQPDIEVDRLIRRGDSIFGVTSNAVYDRDDDGRFERLWPSGELGSNIGFPADLQVADNRVFVGLPAGDTQWVKSPPDQSDTKPTSSGEDAVPADGGLFVADSVEEANFDWFGEDIPVNEDGRPVGVVSMVVDGDTIFVLTSTRGVWRVDLDSGEWTRSHRGLPTGDPTSTLTKDPARQIVQVGQQVYAWNAEYVYRWEGDRWSPLNDEAIEIGEGLSAHFGQFQNGIVGVMDHEGHLLVAHHRGLYEMDRDTGEFNLVWTHPTNRNLRFAAVEDSGLYVGLQHGGLWGSR